ncbi:MAG: hypothetical protein ACF8R7_06710, partial [Phycisphaerales bacterium JB039]
LGDSEAEAEFERLKTLASVIREARAQQKVPQRRRITLHTPGALAAELSRHEDVIGACAGAAVSTAPPPAASVAISFEQHELHLSDLAEAVDAGAERERLARKCDELSGLIGNLDKRLGNPGYVERAPAHLVEETRRERERAAAELASVQKALEQL